MILKQIIRVELNPSDQDDYTWFLKMEDAIQSKQYWFRGDKGLSTVFHSYELTSIIRDSEEVLDELLRNSVATQTNVEESVNWRTIRILSDIRAQYSLFDPKDSEYYHALSEAIRILKAVESSEV